VFCLSNKHVLYEGKPALLPTHLGIKDPLHVFQPLVNDIRTGFSIELGWVVLQDVLQAPFQVERFWFKAVDRGSGHALLQLLEGLHVLPLSSLRSQPCCHHLLHNQLLLLHRCFLTLHGSLMLLHHSITWNHNLYCPCNIWCIDPMRLMICTRRCHITWNTGKTISQA